MATTRRDFLMTLPPLAVAAAKVPSPPSNKRVQDANWLQWGGPNRDFNAEPQRRQGASSRPKKLWSRAIGSGHSAVLSDGTFGYCQYLIEKSEVIEKFHVRDGKPVWKSDYRVTYHASNREYDGPHSTPIFVADHVYGVSIDGNVTSTNTATGGRLWSMSLREEFGISLPQSGYAASPLFKNGYLILPTCGHSSPRETESLEAEKKRRLSERSIPGAIAIDARTGQTVWRSQSFRSSHSSPICVAIDGQDTVVFHGMFELIGLDPASGQILWRHILRREAADNVTFTPIWDKQRQQILVTHGYCSKGAQAIRVTRKGGTWQTRAAWSNPQMQVVHTNAIAIGGMLMATNRSPTGMLVAIDLKTGETRFRRRLSGKSNFLRRGPEILILNEEGELVCAEVDKDNTQVTWRSQVLSSKTWTTPSLVRSTLMVRGDGELAAFNV